MADVFSLDKLSIKKLKALAGRNNVSLRGCFEKSDIIKTLRDAGVKEHSGPPPATSSSNEATPRHAQQYNATVPGQAYTSAYSSPMPSARKPRSKEADLQALSISQLKRVARERRIDTSHCFEKADLIAALRPPPLPPPTASLLPCVRVLPRVRPAPPTGAPPKTTPRAAPPPRRENGKPITPPQRPSFSSGYDEVWDVRREGDKLTPRINTLTRRDSWRERDPYASPYRRDPYRRGGEYRRQPNSARSDRSESSSSSLRRPKPRRASDELPPRRDLPYRDRDPYRRPDPSPRDPYARDRDPYARDRDPYARDRDPYARDRDPYARDRDPYARPASRTATRTSGRRRGTGIPTRGRRRRRGTGIPTRGRPRRRGTGTPTRGRHRRRGIGTRTRGRHHHRGTATPTAATGRACGRRRASTRASSTRGRARALAARARRRAAGRAEPHGEGRGLGPVAARRQRFAHVRTEGLVARLAGLGPFSQARTEGVVADATAAVARFLR